MQQTDVERSIAKRIQDSIRGIQHVKLPVSDVLRSRDWYDDVLGFQPVLDYEEEDGVMGVVAEHPCGVTLGLHLDPDRAAVFRGFDVVSLSVQTKADLDVWAEYLDGLGIAHSPVELGHHGWRFAMEDPDGILIVLHTATRSTADDA